MNTGHWLAARLASLVPWLNPRLDKVVTVTMASRWEFGNKCSHVATFRINAKRRSRCKRCGESQARIATPYFIDNFYQMDSLIDGL